MAKEKASWHPSNLEELKLLFNIQEGIKTSPSILADFIAEALLHGDTEILNYFSETERQIRDGIKDRELKAEVKGISLVALWGVSLAHNEKRLRQPTHGWNYDGKPRG